MSQREFVLDIIINKLNLQDEQIKDAKNLLAKFTFGDIKLDITTDRVNVADFGEGRSIEFTSTLEALKNRLEEIPLELMLINPEFEEVKDKSIDKSEEGVKKDSGNAKKDENDEGNIEKAVKNDESNNDGKSEKEDKIEKSHELSLLPVNVIGIVSLKWPPALINKLTDHCTTVVPHIQVCDIKRDQQTVGSITLGTMLHCKCEEKPSAALNNLPYINEKGILTAFQEARKEMEKKNVFFVIGRNPEPCEQLTDDVYEKMSPCADRQKFPLYLDTSKYKLVRGTLVKDFANLQKGICGEQDCCVNWYERQNEQKHKKSHKKKNRLTCLDIFGPPCGHISAQRSPNVMRVDSASEGRMGYATDRRSNLNSKGSVIQLKQDAAPKNEFMLREDLQAMLAQRSEQYRREEEQVSRPLYHKNILQPRFCPKCCENLTMYSKRAPCSNCGFKLPAKRVFSQNETADDILNQWDPDEKEFLKNSGFTKFDHCTCHERGDRKFKRQCLYCRIRDIRNEITDFGPPEESLTSPRKERILSDSDLIKEKDDDICEKILREYANDKEANTSKAVKVLRQTQTGIDAVGKASENSQNPHPKKSTQKGRKSLSKNEKIMGKNNIREGKENAKLPKKRKTIKEFILEMKRKYGRRYCFPKRKHVQNLLITHEECIPESHPVPPKMGWLWSHDENAMKKGWRPGKIRRPIRELMAYFLTEFPVDSLPTTQELAKLEKYPPESKFEDELVQKPTLRIQKQDGQYLITMHPLKTEQELKFSADPYAKANPIQFKIAKHPLDMKRRQVKRYLKEIGFRKCTCSQPVSKCNCRTYVEKQRLDNSLKYICDLIQASSLRDAVCLSDTTESDSHMNIEFTPPAGVIKPHLKVKPDIAENYTQYDSNDCSPQFVKRTEELIRQEIKKKNRHYCAGPIQTTPCHTIPGEGRKKKKKKKSKGKEKIATKDLIGSQSKNKEIAARIGKGKE